MLSSDQETYEALNSLTTAARDQPRPFIIWIGAGVSSWAGYPFWLDLAAKMHTTFSREERGYDKDLSSLLLKEAKYPELFEQMRLANQSRYFTFLSEQFRPKHTRGVYDRFIRSLCKLPNAHIVTTNVDEALEHSLSGHITVQRSDIECLPQLLHQRTPFICKLHGSASSVESMVFSKRDYEFIQLDDVYLNAVRTMFSDATVLFLGYGLRDEYVLQSLQTSSNLRPLFGAGPHFIVTSEERIELPDTIRRIRYEAEVADHRDALQILEVIADFTPSHPVQTKFKYEETTSTHPSLYYIADLVAPGRWETSQTLCIEGSTQQIIVGEGYVDGEIELHNYSALHDIVVGLLCFDIVCVTIGYLGRVHDLLGSEVFWIFVESASLRVVIPPSTPSVIFADDQSPIGDLADIILGSSSSSVEEFSPISISERIRKQLMPVQGKENEAEKLFKLLESSVLDLSQAQLSDSVAVKTRSALINPTIRRMLGVSSGTPRVCYPSMAVVPDSKACQSDKLWDHLSAHSSQFNQNDFW